MHPVYFRAGRSWHGGGNGGSSATRLTPEVFTEKLDLQDIVEKVTADGNPTEKKYPGMDVTTMNPINGTTAAVQTFAAPRAAGAGKLYLSFNSEGYTTTGELRIVDGVIELTFDTDDSNSLTSFHIKVLKELVALYSTDDEPYTVSVTEEDNTVSGKLHGTMTVIDNAITFSSVTNITISMDSSLVVDGDTVQAGGVAGDGTEANPYVFMTADQLFAFAADYNAGDINTPVYAELGSDINLNEMEWTPIGISTRTGYNVIEGSVPFVGVFDGNDHTIEGLHVSANVGNEDIAVGFFSALKGADTKVMNLNISGDITTDSSSSGFISGIVFDNAVIEKCTTLAGSQITAPEAGGIIGRLLASGSIKSSTNNAAVTATSGKAGGIVNSAYYDQNSGDDQSYVYTEFSIEGCVNNGVIDGSSSGFTGGIAGLAGGGVKIINCTNNESGTVSGSGPGVGGIAGQLIHGASLDDCYNHAYISNTSGSTGGLVGWIRYYDDANYNNYLVCYIKNSHNDGDVKATTQNAYAVGGAVGMVYWAADISSSTSSGTVSCDTNNMIGGFCGGVQYLSQQDKDDSTEGPTTTIPDANYSEERDKGITFTDCHSDDATVLNTEGVVGTFIGHNVNCLIPEYTEIVTTITGCTPNGEGSGIKSTT